MKESTTNSPAAGWVVAITGAIIVGYLFSTNGDPKPFEVYNFINTGLCLWMPLMILMLVLRLEPSEFGLTIGDSKTGFRWSFVLWLLMLIPVIVASFRPEFRTEYLTEKLSQFLQGVGPVYNGLFVNKKSLLYYELSMGFYMFCWEFFFRGYLLFGLKRLLKNDHWAVILQTIPFALLHWSWQAGASKPGLEILGSIPAGIALGYFAPKTRSCVYGFLTHWAVSATLDVLLLLHVYR